LLNLILENETYMNIEKKVFLDRINEAIDAILTVSGKGVVLTCLSVKSDSDMKEAVTQAIQDYGLHPQEVKVDTPR
jgi:predicted lactoylglutathione lyase